MSMAHVFANLRHERMFVRLLRGGREVGFGDIAGVDAGFATEEEEGLQKLLFFIIQFQCDRRLHVIEMGHELLAEGVFSRSFLDATFRILLGAGQASAHTVHVCEDQFGIDHFDVTDRVHTSVHMRDVATFKAAHDVDDGVDFTDMAQELIPQAFAFTRAFHKAGDIDKLNRSGNEFVGARDF